MTKLDFTKHLAAQDMIKTVMKKKGFSEKEAVDFSVNRDIFRGILEAGYASIALDLWGHADSDRKWETLDNPVIEIEFDEEKQGFIDKIIKKEKADIETSVSYFLIFTMESLGYHI